MGLVGLLQLEPLTHLESKVDKVSLLLVEAPFECGVLGCKRLQQERGVVCVCVCVMGGK
jgi:hypothetical protein